MNRMFGWSSRGGGRRGRMLSAAAARPPSRKSRREVMWVAPSSPSKHAASAPERGADLIRARAFVAVEQRHGGVVCRHGAGAKEVGKLAGAARAGEAQGLPLPGERALLGVVEDGAVVLVAMGRPEVVGAVRQREGAAQ